MASTFLGLPSVCEEVLAARRQAAMGEVMQVDAGETGKASASATNARGRARAGTDNCLSPRNLDKKFRLLLPDFWKGELVIEKEVQEDSCLVSLDLP